MKSLRNCALHIETGRDKTKSGKASYGFPRRSPIRCFVEWLRHRRKTSQNFFPLQLLVSCYYCVRLSWKSHDSAVYGRQEKVTTNLSSARLPVNPKTIPAWKEALALGINNYFLNDLCFYCWIIESFINSSILVRVPGKTLPLQVAYQNSRKETLKKIYDCSQVLIAFTLKSEVEVIKKCASHESSLSK